MINSINITNINETNTQIYVKPALERQEDLDFNYDDISLTWNLTKFS